MAKSPLCELVSHPGFNTGLFCWQAGHSEVATDSPALVQGSPSCLSSMWRAPLGHGHLCKALWRACSACGERPIACCTRGPLSIDCWGPLWSKCPPGWHWCETWHLHSLSVLTPLPQVSWSPIFQAASVQESYLNIRPSLIPRARQPDKLLEVYLLNSSTTLEWG